MDALELILEEGALADQRFVLGVRLDGRLGVRQEVLELVQHLASGGGEWDRRGAWERKGDEGGREREDVSADALNPERGGRRRGREGRAGGDSGARRRTGNDAEGGREREASRWKGRLAGGRVGG